MLPAFVCPQCHGALQSDSDAYLCRQCQKTYPVILGIPDFRLAPDPWIGIDEDREKARRLAPLIASQTFAEAVQTYWDITPTTSSTLSRRYIQHVVDAEHRAEQWLDAHADRVATGGCWLDLGCGTAELVSVGATRGVTVVGVDIALRWLVVASRRAHLMERAPQLVCANAEFLPFAEKSFVRAVSLGLLEHCPDASHVVNEARRVLRPPGLLLMRTVNRFSLLPEPHVHVWGVGFVPRRWADRYVHWRAGLRYQHHRPLSARELRQGFEQARFADVHVEAAALLPLDRDRIPRWARRVATLYNWAARAPIFRDVLQWIAPILQVRGRVT